MVDLLVLAALILAILALRKVGKLDKELQAIKRGVESVSRQADSHRRDG